MQNRVVKSANPTRHPPRVVEEVARARRELFHLRFEFVPPTGLRVRLNFRRALHKRFAVTPFNVLLHTSQALTYRRVVRLAGLIQRVAAQVEFERKGLKCMPDLSGLYLARIASSADCFALFRISHFGPKG
jgi:hypothetical protein